MLFADSILESRAAGRGWTTLVTYMAEAILVGLVVVAPMLNTTMLPALHMSPPVVMRLGNPPREAATPQPLPGSTSPSESAPTQLVAPGKIPPHVLQTGDESQPPSLSGAGTFNRDGNEIRDPRGVPGGILGANTTVPILAHPTVTQPPTRPRISEPSPADLINGPRPQYPAPARVARIEGTVVLNAIIARDGSIQRLQAVSGHPMLVSAALDAVRQWRYRPYMLNSEAVEVETQITVNFTLAR